MEEVGIWMAGSKDIKHIKQRSNQSQSQSQFTRDAVGSSAAQHSALYGSHLTAAQLERAHRTRRVAKSIVVQEQPVGGSPTLKSLEI